MSSLPRYECYIDGSWTPPHSGDWIETIDPYHDAAWAEIPRCDEVDAQNAAQAAERALRQGAWPALSASGRGALLRRLGDLMAREAERLAELETRDNGKLYAETLTQARYAPQWMYYFGGLADKIEGAVLPTDKLGIFNFTRSEPVGVVLALTAWNSPLLLAAYKLAPALAAGCTVILKPSEHASVSTLELGKLIEEAGFPPGVVNIVTGYGAEVGAALMDRPEIAKITLTGGPSAGRSAREAAARGPKRLLLELGGKSANIVFDDANLDAALSGVVSGIFAAGGQTCVAGSRLLLQDTIYDAFLERLCTRASAIVLGDPRDPGTEMGPLAFEAHATSVIQAIERAKDQGARCVLGGRRADLGRCFVEPTIFVDVANTMPIAREEVFGPVLCVMRFQDEAQALEIANDTRFGLAAGLWTRDMARTLRMARALQCGTVWANTYRAVSYLSPFGGFKESGVGRENGQEAIREFLHTKSVWIAYGDGAPENPFTIR